MDACAGGIAGIADFHGEKGNIVSEFGTANLHLRGDLGGLAAKKRTAHGISRRRGFARLIQKHEAPHQRDTGRGSHAGKRFPVANREKAHKLGLVLGTSRGKHGFQRDAGSVCGGSFARRARGASAGVGTGILGTGVRGCQQHGAAEEKDSSTHLRFP